MANIGATEFYIGVPSLPRADCETYSTQLFDEWESYVDKVLKLPDYSIALETEEGSIKAVGKVAAALGVLYVGIGQYGSFINGLEIIQQQVRDVGDYFAERAGAPFAQNRVKPRVRKRGESLARLKKLFANNKNNKGSDPLSRGRHFGQIQQARLVLNDSSIIMHYKGCRFWF